jgi:fibronectin-binding autotransporter adhesin
MAAPLSLGRNARLILALLSNLFAISVLAWVGATPVLAQTDTFIASSGFWSEDENWSLDAVPVQGNDCVLPANSVVTSDLAGVCTNFALGSGGTLTLTPGYLKVYGSNFNNQGTISVGAGSGLQFPQPSVTATISGGGTINLTNPNSNLAGSQNSVINVDNSIHGQGFIGVAQFTNQSLIDANVSGAALQLHAGGNVGITNTGTVQASNGGTLQLTPTGSGVPFNNTGGILQALNGSVVQLNAGYVITGGTLSTSGTGTFHETNVTTLNNLVSNANYQLINGNITILEGTITNNGSFQELQGGLQVTGNATLKGTGVVAGGTGQLLASNTPPAALINQSTFQGGGTMGDSGLTITNRGTINANDVSSNLIIAGNPITNSLLMEATGGGTLEIRNTVNNTGATIEAQTGSAVLLNTGTINGGTLKTTGTGVINSENALLDGTVNVVTNEGLLKASGFNLTLKGTINNTGMIALGKTGGCVALEAPTALTGSGKVTMTSANCFFGFSATNTLTNQNTIAGAGSIGGSNPMGITNSGTILANSTSPLTIAPDATLGFTNTGKLIANKGSVLNIAGLFNNFSGTTLMGGTYSVAGTLEFQNVNIVTNAANLTLTGATAQILNSSTNSSALADMAANTTAGSLSLQGGQVLSTATNFSNAGKTTVGAGSGFTVGGSYTQTAGTTTVDGTLTAPTGLILQKGSMLGKGTLAAAVTSAASVTAGDSASKPAKLTVTGSYTQDSKGTLNISIGGTAVGSFGQVAVSNGVSPGGTLVIKLVNGFVPVVGEMFKIVTGSAVSGQFATVKGLSINASEHFEIGYTATAVTLTVVSGP